MTLVYLDFITSAVKSGKSHLSHYFIFFIEVCPQLRNLNLSF